MGNSVSLVKMKRRKVLVIYIDACEGKNSDLTIFF